MTAKPHDALFKTAFESPEHAAGIFRTLLPSSLSAAIAWGSMKLESGTFIDPDLADRHSDLLFSVRLRNNPAFLYLLLEHRSRSDPQMPFRMLVYLVRIWERFRKESAGPLPLIIPAVISHAPGGWTGPVTFDALFEPDPKSIAGLAEIVPRFSLLVEDLAHLSNEDLKGRALAAFPKLALWVLRDARDTEQLLGNLSHWATAFREALRTPNGMQALAQLMRYIALVSDELHFEQFRAKIREQVPEAEEAAMTIAEQMRREGREEGRLETLRGTLHKLVLLKFGEPTNEYKQRIEAASIEELDSYVERVLTAKTVDALFDR